MPRSPRLDPDTSVAWPRCERASLVSPARRRADPSVDAHMAVRRDRVAVREIRRGQRPRNRMQKDLMTLKGSKIEEICATPSGSNCFDLEDPGVSPRSTPGYYRSAFQADLFGLQQENEVRR